MSFSWIISLSPCYSETTFTDATVEAGVAYSPDMTWGCSFVDVNHDGYVDIFVGNHWHQDARLYLNNANGTFTDVAALYGLLRTDFSNRPNTTDTDFHGTAWGDFDNDGDEDLYIVVGGGGGTAVGSNHLMRNDGSTFTEITSTAGVADEYGRGRTPMWVDYDNDGNLDLFVVNKDGREVNGEYKGYQQLFRNNGNQTFTEVTESAGLFNLSSYETAVWGDYDQDGDMDLFLTAPYIGNPYLYGNGSPILYRNNGDGTFTDVTSEAGLNENSTDWKWGEGIVLGDYDNDGDLDLFVAQGADNYGVIWDANAIKFVTLCRVGQENLLNFKTTGDQVTFKLSTYGGYVDPDWIFIGQNGYHPTFDADESFTLSDGEAYGRPESPDDVVFLVWQDSDDKEWHISMQRSVNWPCCGMDNRSGLITSNGSFYDVTQSNMGWPYNSYRSFLFRNNGDGTFTDVTRDAGFVNEAGNIIKGMSSSVFWADLDNDGYIDLYVVNFGAFENAPNWFFHNNGDGTFTEMASTAGIDCMVEGRGDVGIFGDYNNDGFLDIFVSNSRTFEIFGQGPYVLYKNNGNNNNWLEIKTIGTLSNRDGIGAKVKVTTGGMVQFREQNGGTTLYGQNSTILHFGLGSASTIDRLEVEWPSGKSQEYLNLAVNQILTLTEPGVTWGDVISAYNEYVSGNNTWADVIATYQSYVSSQL
jgi:hypothetical protein